MHDDDHLLFNIASPRRSPILRLDPRIEINCVDIFSRRGYRFTGHASVRSAGDPIYDECAAACVPSMAMPSRSTMPWCLSGCFLPNQFFHPPTLMFRA